jgi:hypothetical protein
MFKLSTTAARKVESKSETRHTKQSCTLIINTKVGYEYNHNKLNVFIDHNVMRTHHVLSDNHHKEDATSAVKAGEIGQPNPASHTQPHIGSAACQRGPT